MNRVGKGIISYITSKFDNSNVYLNLGPNFNWDFLWFYPWDSKSDNFKSSRFWMGNTYASIYQDTIFTNHNYISNFHLISWPKTKQI